MKYVFVFCCALIAIAATGQVNISKEDSTFLNTFEEIELFEEQSNLNPQRSALLSAVFPGLGQIYNKQYWKAPIVMTGVVLFGHFINYNNQLYHAFRNATILEVNGLDNPYENVIGGSTALSTNRDDFRRNRDYLMILGTAFYLLQIVDAHVSAHLEEFNVNEELSVGIRPSIQSSPVFSQAVGVSLYLNF